MPEKNVAPLEASIEIAAPPAQVWELVSDLTNMRRWSPQNVLSVLLGKPAVGTRFVNLNRKGLLVWPTTARIVDLVPQQRIAFRVADNWTVWSLALEPTASGTRLVQRREAPEGISPVSAGLTKAVMGGQERFYSEIEDGMRATLAKIKAEAEAA